MLIIKDVKINILFTKDNFPGRRVRFLKPFLQHLHHLLSPILILMYVQSVQGYELNTSILRTNIIIQIFATVKIINKMSISSFFWISCKIVQKITCLCFNPIPQGGHFSLHSTGGGINLTHTFLTASEGSTRHILCNII